MPAAKKSIRAVSTRKTAFNFGHLFPEANQADREIAESESFKPKLVTIEVSSRRQAQALDLLVKSASTLLERTDRERLDNIWAANIAAAIPLQDGLLSQTALAVALFRKALAEIPMLTSEQVGALSGSEASNPAGLAATWVNRKQVFGVSVGGLGQRYPDFQFQENGKPWPVLAKTLARLSEHFRPTMLLLWFNEPHPSLGNKRPRMALADEGPFVTAVDATLKPIDFF